MAKAVTYAKVTVIALLNFGIVGFSSIFAVYGDGTSGGMNWVLGIGGAWVFGFAIRAYWLVDRGEESRAVSVVSGTLLYGFAAALLGSLAHGVVGQLWGSR